jgi:predicted metal-dependent peptidase
MVDTSGSVDATSLSYARGIVESVIEETNPLAVTVYYADAEVKRVDRFEQGDPLTWEPKGGGGTDFCPVLEAIETEGSAVCAVCITDLDGTLPDVPPGYPVLWLCTSDLIAPFGETVPVDR